MLKKLKCLITGNKRELECDNIQLKRSKNETKTEKNINAINNAMNTNSIFY